MKRMLLVAILLVGGLSGCKNVVGPFDSRQRSAPPDPLLPIPEQESRARARYSLPFDDPATKPSSYADFYGPTRSRGPGSIR